MPPQFYCVCLPMERASNRLHRPAGRQFRVSPKLSTSTLFFTCRRRFFENQSPALDIFYMGPRGQSFAR